MGLAGLDVAIIVAYLVFAVGLGFYFSRSNTSTEAFFLGSRDLPGWALGLSLLSTSISSNSFLAVPAYSYASDFGLLLKDAVLPIPAAVAALLVVPFFRQEGMAGRWQGRQPWGRKAGGTAPWGSAFEFLEDRFGKACRRYAALCYVCMQMVRTSSILYLVSIPVTLFTGLSGEVAIVATACFVACYSTLGGVRAVVFTDVVQAAILLGGGIGTVLVIASRLPNGFSTILADGAEAHKFSLIAGGRSDFSLRDRTVWSVMATGLIAHFSSYTAGQDCVQRYLAAKTLYEARKAVVICALLSIPTWSFFNFVGVALYSFYRHNPVRLSRLSGLEPFVLRGACLVGHIDQFCWCNRSRCCDECGCRTGRWTRSRQTRSFRTSLPKSSPRAWQE
jgi:solute:Na+ symporter, SSS family